MTQESEWDWGKSGKSSGLMSEKTSNVTGSHCSSSGSPTPTLPSHPQIEEVVEVHVEGLGGRVFKSHDNHTLLQLGRSRGQVPRPSGDTDDVRAGGVGDEDDRRRGESLEPQDSER